MRSWTETTDGIPIYNYSIKVLKTKFVTAELGGGCGAQMFMIAHVCAQGLRYGVESIFSEKNYFTYNYDPTFWPSHFRNNIYRKLNFVDTLDNYILLEETDFLKNKYYDLFEFDQNIMFRGYFESRKNFLGYDDYIRDLFSPTEDFFIKVKRLYPIFFESNCVAMHIRRGDFLKIQDILPVVDISYLDECVDRIGNYDYLFIFSNDIEYAKNLNYKKTIVVENLENYECLWFMSLFKTLIMANSTFSWWSQFLNQNIDKKVFVPSTWFGPNAILKFKETLFSMGLDINTSTLRHKENYWYVVDTYYKDGFIVKK